jgi:hypothetical protein
MERNLIDMKNSIMYSFSDKTSIQLIIVRIQNRYVDDTLFTNFCYGLSYRLVHIQHKRSIESMEIQCQNCSQSNDNYHQLTFE